MAKAKYESIYRDLKLKIEDEEYEYQSILPSESTLVGVYDCSRNTVRRALAQLAEIGYVQAINGVGVRVIYQPYDKASFIIGGIETFKETAARNKLNSDTEVVMFAEIVADARVAKRTGFAEGTELYYIQRLRKLDGKPCIMDINMFDKSIVTGITPEIAAKSIYDYIENELKMEIGMSKRKMTVERVTEVDSKYLSLGDYNCLAVVTSQTFNGMGIMFEYTQSRHVPEYFCFMDTAVRSDTTNK
ncbi:MULTISPECIES: UTRA domain-containing protein [Pseudobutyrivibrio]|uniref:GntR family transcriptional regulator n=2 Tax=Pseudobutyrivibrio TaxID=46205 RepID=A0A2G3E761_9FIRM|nr:MULTISPECIES: UTRA domain-containing protein [Pseudobutyrivibrio]MBR5952017.1 UTRA domain-containing protein [Pseudobutyrivibrio sp.]NEX00764.1 UTRA domain-containing protein [Pseudobutyrivibrio xylanivorans]PHU39077.1 GntR family transcriptional regulator [Pseudobutyrivibrio ruminis]SFR62532.1 transcriptional regulator, GntR family [Pseudobutyrivibrio sp. NOR37]